MIMNKLVFKFSLFILGVLLIVISYFTQPSAEMNRNNNLSSSSIIDTQFQIGAIQDGYGNMYNHISDSLRFNVWHQYTSLEYGWNGSDLDNYLAPINQYDTIVIVKVAVNNSYNLRTYFDRPTVSYIISGQRTDYECEIVPLNNLYWFNSYYNSVINNNVSDFTDNTAFGGGARVKQCLRNNADPDSIAGYINTGIKANRNLSYGVAANPWCSDDAWDWYIMPKIRIDSSYAAGTAHNGDTVCKVIITGWNGNIVKNIPLKVINFKRSISDVYNGSYKDEFNFYGQDSLKIDTATIRSQFFPPAESSAYNWDDTTCYVDIKIYWTGKCDMWVDRVRLENEPAHQYLTVKNQYWIDKVNAEINWANNNKDIPNYFYFEENTLSHFPLIKALNKQILDNSDPPNSNCLMIWYNDYQVNAQIPDYGHFTNSQIKELLIDSCKLKTIMIGWYGLEGWQNTQYPNRISYHPSSLTSGSYSEIDFRLSYPENALVYDLWLQNRYDTDFSASNNLINVDKLMDSLSRAGLNVINCPQAHSFFAEGGPLKEPTNEEIELQTCLALTYNAKGIMFYCFNSSENLDKNEWGKGIMNLDNSERRLTAYGQDKYKQIKSISNKLNKWGPYFKKFDPNQTKSCIYRFEDERDNFLTNTSFADVITYKTSSTTPECTEDNPGGTSPQGLVFECKPDRYLQTAIFKKSTSDINKYFMVVNRRCSPYKDETSEDNRGGKRFVRVRFDANSLEFANFNNWKIIELDSNKTVTVFDKRATALLDLGWYLPGEGKLYKISPVMQEGGTLVCDEYINTNFTCNGMVYGNGHNITINQGKTISFNEDGGIFMEGGCFVSGINSDNADAVTLQSTGEANHWKGITLSGCDSVGIYNTITSNAESNDTPKTYSYSIINSYKVDFRKCNFITENDRGIIEAVYNSSSEVPAILKIRESNFFMENCGYPAINVLSNASSSIPLIAEWCTFHSKDNDTSCAVMLTGVAGGAVKNCYFYDFGKTMIFISSTVDLYGNLILGGNNSEGLQCLSGSSVSLGPNSGLYLGGYNYIRNYGTSSSNIYTDNSFFNIDCGNNEFDIDETEYSKHLTGTMRSDDEPDYVDAFKNCFHEDSITNIEAIHDVIWSGSNSNVNFLFEPYFCDLTPPQDFVVFDVYGFPDTVYYKSGGEGGGFNPNKTLNIEENTYKSLKDTVNINLRKRNYQTVETNSKLILTQYPDSLESIGMVQKLYMASLNLDSTKIGLTKMFLENLISNNTQNPSLIKRAFYFIQKCKVKLEQYQSALEGFQYIMTQNPYTYEGLVASWDYAATYLLMGTGGSIQGDNEQTLEDFNTPADTLLSRMSRRDINTNRNTNSNTSTKTNLNTNEQTTKIFYEKIKNTTKDDRLKQEEKVKTLEKTLESSKSTPEKNEAARELAVMKHIKEAVKIKKPNTVMNHIQIMNDDIKKVFGVGKQSTKESTNSLIPQTYQLYQNYPNPFNPTTKIAFDLPKDAKVKLVIYDILGREMKTLVNNEFRSAGKYITEFNGSNMASGIYFARILINEGRDFVAVRKMVFLK